MEIIKVEDLHKSFNPKNKKAVAAVDGINLNVQAGSIYGFIGPNGAGKTTTMRILVTLLKPDKGRVEIAGYDLVNNFKAIRANIGYIGQKHSCHGATTAFENIFLQARLHGMNKSDAHTATQRMIKLFELESFSDRKTENLSGGQKRRIDIAIGMVHSPKILFLDEPTTGLDIQSRAFLWSEIQRLRDNGTTIFLTTHYLEEADQVCEQIAIIDHGKIIAEGAIGDLKRQFAGDVLTISIGEHQEIPENILTQFKATTFINDVSINRNHIRLYLKPDHDVLSSVIETIKLSNLQINAMQLAQPSLDELFLEKTGRSLRDRALMEENA